MFMGEYKHSIDKKGRIILPAKFRSTLAEKYIDRFVITRGFDDCLSVFPMNEWKLYEAELRKLSQSNADTRYFLRILFANATDTALDKQGRMFIPAELRAKVAIEKDVTVLGAMNLIEIWSKQKWEDYQSKGKDKPIESVAQKLFDLGIMK
ncbi:MAG: division/cell wall cluster transcriptional repressor MraZ [Candidatus Firestonebacteria bacterium]|jgi:MraZ protein|nr:division/cell wall cluster transcriptional repressor MraZ [Candidatus Firestonebacteria bacterium]